ncbi:hypothetical protein EYF80_021182 [Liparis tanakae]|uniref:Uncharacterized protein n=1 Tax=Liparis tanakae TaxID=230148 RepID=A0A4Z2HRR9_9TELE|nr:hypothetical protein EYF80_021182 [Liparis tanakae]
MLLRRVDARRRAADLEHSKFCVEGRVSLQFTATSPGEVILQAILSSGSQLRLAVVMWRLLWKQQSSSKKLTRGRSSTVRGSPRAAGDGPPGPPEQARLTAVGPVSSQRPFLCIRLRDNHAAICWKKRVAVGMSRGADPDLQDAAIAPEVVLNVKKKKELPKVSLHQGGADLRVGGQGALRKALAVGRRLVRVEAAEHLGELLASAVADVLLQVDAARSDQGGVQPLYLSMKLVVMKTILASDEATPSRAFSRPLKISADEGGVYVLQQDDALLRRHAQQVVQAVVREALVAQTHQTDAVAQLACQGRAARQRADGDGVTNEPMGTELELQPRGRVQTSSHPKAHSHEAAFPAPWGAIQQIASSVGTTELSGLRRRGKPKGLQSPPMAVYITVRPSSCFRASSLAGKKHK